MDIGTAVTKCRQVRGMTQVQLAAAASMSASYLNLIEKNNRQPRVDILQKISKGLGVPLSVLIFLGSESDDIAEMESSQFTELLDSVQDIFKRAFPTQTEMEF